jgi:pyruvate dehydrogenase E1 component alpha subunit
MALEEDGRDGVCVCSFGDGTANRGDFHEALNLAAVWRLPIVYICQDNGWSISQPAPTYLPAPVAERAAGYGIPGVGVDGNDVEAVRTIVNEAIARARKGDGPSLIEARTWRWRGHWAGDNQAYRAGPEPADVEDPLDLYAYRLLSRGAVPEAELTAVHADVRDEVRRAIERAQAAPDGGATELGLDEVYA